MVQGAAGWIALKAQPAGSIGLGIAINDKGLQGLLSEGGAQIDGGGRLTDSALLIGNGDDASQHSTPVFKVPERNLPEGLTLSKGRLAGFRPNRIVFNDIVAFIKLPFIFNNIVALMCSLLFLNGLVTYAREYGDLFGGPSSVRQSAWSLEAEKLAGCFTWNITGQLRATPDLTIVRQG